MSDQGVAVGQLRAFVDRVERLEEEIKTLNDDKSEVYKEMRGSGFDVKAVRKVVAKRKLDPHVRDEQDTVFELYWDALTGASHVHVHEEGNSYAAEKGIDPKLAYTIVAGLQTETGRNALIAAVDIMIEREEQIDPDSNKITNSPETAYEILGGVAGSCSGIKCGENRTGTESETIGDSVERHVTQVDAVASAEAAVEGQPSLTAATSAESAGEAVSADLPTNFEPPAFLQPKPLKTARDYRPHCQKPEACGASGLKHCYSCSKLVPQESEVA